MAAFGAVIKVVVGHVALTFALLAALTFGRSLSTTNGVVSIAILAALVAAPLLLTDAKLTSPQKATGELRPGFVAVHHLLVTARRTEVREWASDALRGLHARSIETDARHIGGWVAGTFAHGYVPASLLRRQYQLVVFDGAADDEGMVEITIAARPRRRLGTHRANAVAQCERLVREVEDRIGQPRLVLLGSPRWVPLNV